MVALPFWEALILQVLLAYTVTHRNMPIDRKIGFLTINKVTRADETEYKCAIKDETNLYSEPDESFVKLDVIENPGNVIDNLLHNAILIST